MILARSDNARLRKLRIQHNPTSNVELMTCYQSHSSAQMQNYPDPQLSTSPKHHGSSESRNYKGREPKNKKTFLLATLTRLGCKGTEMPATSLIQSAAERDTGERRKKKQRRKAPRKARSPANLADIPDICCAPPGISYVSDVVPRHNMNDHRRNHIQHDRAARRIMNIHDNSPSHPRGTSRSHKSNGRRYPYFPRGISEVQLINPGYTLFARSLNEYDLHRDWRLNVDSMSYEELLDLGDKIGYVGKGLREEEITRCLKISKLSIVETVPLLISTDKDWRCSICQEGCAANDDAVGLLGCGHCHHLNCIKQWLLLKNECPVCKIAPMASKRV